MIWAACPLNLPRPSNKTEQQSSPRARSHCGMVRFPDHEIWEPDPEDKFRRAPDRVHVEVLKIEAVMLDPVT